MGHRTKTFKEGETSENSAEWDKGSETYSRTLPFLGLGEASSPQMPL